MPIYEYRCAGCGRVFEILHLGKEKSEDVVCPSCGSPGGRKLFSVAAALEQPGRGTAEPGGCCGGACRMDADSWK